MPKKTTKQQVAYLLSKVSPLSASQKEKFKKELHSGAAKIVEKRRKVAK